MIDAARAAGVRRFIHVSSLAAREPELSDYGWSKARVGAPRRRLGPRLDDPAAAGDLRPRRPRDVRIVQDGPPRPRRAAAQGPLLGPPCRGSLPADPRPARRARHDPPDLRARRRPRRRLGPPPFRPHPGPRSSASAPPTVAMPKPVMRRRRQGRPAGPPRQGQADPGPGPLFLPSRLGRRRRGAPAGRLWTAGDPHRRPASRTTADWYRRRGLAALEPQTRSAQFGDEGGEAGDQADAGRCGRHSRAAGISCARAPGRSGRCRAASPGRRRFVVCDRLDHRGR